MLKEEFEERAKIHVNGDEFEEINACYMNAIPVVDKDAFVRRWLREGGVQGIIDKRGAEIVRLRGICGELNRAAQQEERTAYEAWVVVRQEREENAAIRKKLAAIQAAAA